MMDEMCRSGCEVFKAVYQDAQRYEQRGLMAHMLTRLMVLDFTFFLSVLKLNGEGALHTVFHFTHTRTHTHNTQHTSHTSQPFLVFMFAQSEVELQQQLVEVRSLIDMFVFVCVFMFMFMFV